MKGFMIKWIFFDIGNVILNDDPAMAELYRQLFEFVRRKDHSITMERLLQEREELIRQKRDGRHYFTLMEKYLNSYGHAKFKIIREDLNRRWGELSPLMAGIVPVLDHLHTTYRLGLIANQPEQVVEVLENHRLSRFFTVQALSDISEMKKPDIRFFKYALVNAGCRPDESVMVGDRIDNDIAPARAIGMHTIWLKLSYDSKGYVPATEHEQSYLASVARASATHLEPRFDDEMPDFIARSFGDIVTGIRRIEAAVV